MREQPCQAALPRDHAEFINSRFFPVATPVPDFAPLYPGYAARSGHASVTSSPFSPCSVLLAPIGR
jgi:hypothetical protein